MKNFTKHLFIFLALAGFCHLSIQAQNVLNPADPVLNYDSLHKPAQPFYGKIGKWVRTPRAEINWNTDSYKAYIYKGIAFRIKFPKTYNPAAVDGKKYPMLLFWHGLGERADLYDNEFHLLLGCKKFRDAIDNGTFDGYVIAMQTLTELSGFFGSSHYQAMKELIDTMVLNNKLDPFQIVNNGLSSGGIASMNMFLEYPTYSNGIITMSPPGNYTTPDVLNKDKFIPIWYSNGGLDNNPTVGTADYNKYIMDSAGADFKRKTYWPNYHNTWDDTWSEPDFWPFINSAYASNPWPLYGKTTFSPGELVNATIGLAPGFDAYQWRKDGNLISGSTNSIQVNQFGLYDARVLKGGIWSNWSKKPVLIKAVPGPSLKIEAENHTAMLGIQLEATSDYGGGQNVAWQDNNDWMDYAVNLPVSASYTVKFRVATQFNGVKFQLRKSDGTILSTVTVPNTSGFQFFKDVSTTVSLPAGQQTLRVFTTLANGGWNFNWMEFSPEGAVQAPPLNQPPVANAGSGQTITLPTSSVQLNGSGTDNDGTISAYNWTQVSGPSVATFSNDAAAVTTVSALVQGSYVFRLQVTDNLTAIATSDVTIIVNPAPSNPPPATSFKIEAENFSAMFGIQLENTNDAGGGQNVAWQDNNDWMDYSLNIATAGTFTVNFRVASMFTGAQFQLRKSDGTVLSNITVPNTGNFQSWQTVSSTISLPAGLQTLRVFTTLANGGWNFNWLEFIPGGTTPPPVNQPPVANAGSAQSITLPTSSVQLNGSGTDSDGSISTYLWTQVSGPSTATFSPASAATASVTMSALVQGSYIFRLRVTDNQNATATSDVTVTVNPAPSTPPPATSVKIEAENYTAMFGIQLENTNDAGGGQNVGWQDINDWLDYSLNIATAGTFTVNFRVASMFTGAQFQLRKSDGTVLANITVPNTGNFQSWQTVSSTISLPAGVQTLRVVTTLANGGWNFNWMEFVAAGTPQPPANQSPVANAGSAQTITLPTSSTQLNGSGTDSDGSISAYNWSQVSGPSTASFSPASAATASVTVSGLVQGSYIFRLRVTDNKNASATNDVTITVNPAQVTPPPSSTIKIEAENYSTMFGIQLENTADIGGGRNVGWQDTNDWMNYSVTLPVSGTYTVRFRVASQNTGAQFQLRRSNGTILTTLTVPNTGNFQSWQTITTTVSLTSGLQTLRIFTSKANGGWNLNWMEFVPPAATFTVATPTSENLLQNDYVAKSLEIYPNPVTDNFNLQLNNELTGRVKVRIVNMAGATVKVFDLNKSQAGLVKEKLSIGELGRGAYILSITMNGKEETSRLIKQ